MKEVGILLILFSLIILIFGLFLTFSSKIPLIGKLPGDILIKKNSFTFFFPITTSILINVVLSLILFLIQEIKGE